MKYMPGNIYQNACFSSIAQFLGVLSCGIICDKFGPRRALVISFSIAGLFGFFLAIAMQNVELVPYFIFCASFGIGSSFHIGYLAN
jgi:nitrate/nitrite transporter NarK